MKTLDPIFRTNPLLVKERKKLTIYYACFVDGRFSIKKTKILLDDFDAIRFLIRFMKIATLF